MTGGGARPDRPRRRRRAQGVPGEITDPVAVADALAAVGDELGLPDRVVLAALTERWEDVVGAAVAPHARLRSLRDGVLTIAVDAPAWGTELRYQESTLRERVSEVTDADAVRTVRVVVDPRPE